ncbi:hypothetical protein CCR75_006587 [Bremia lactucae]|uniref:Crinkler effector protein N-terminal domain-containing protein n=1 Tax=Bremia lactucae TaxID=4779 RepID=A0A976FRA1_BRELC|nr:hypothetical protein CCR75_006587 [Bremia lactucae]
MVLLFCAIVDVKGPAFSVQLDENDTIDALKKEIKKESEDITVPAKNLQLFLAKKDNGLGPWLTISEVHEGVEDASGFKSLLFEDEKLRDVGLARGQVVEVSAELRAVGKGFCHVLVQLPDRGSTWQLLHNKCPPLAIEHNNPLVRIPTAYTVGSGVAADEGKDLLLYRRSQLIEEWQTLNTCVCNSFAELWIVGPPGTGKSCAAFAFACSLDRTDWDVVWVHLPKDSISMVKCILFRGANEKWFCEITSDELDTVLQSLKKKTILFVDGYMRDTESGEYIGKSCIAWRAKTEGSSMATHSKDDVQDQCDVISTNADAFRLRTTARLPEEALLLEVKDVMLFKLMSRTFEEYEMALKLDEFFEHVKSKFTNTLQPVPWEERKQLLEDKYFVAVTSLTSLRAIPCVVSKKIVHRLFSCFRDPTGLDTCIVSSYVARKYVKILGPDFVQKIATSLSRNPWMDGQFFELWFFSTLQYGGVQCFKLGDNGETFVHDTWKTNDVPFFDPKGYIPLNQTKQWLEPRSWNRGGYDAVYVKSSYNSTGASNGLVRFVQITRADKHSFKAHYLALLLVKLTNFLRAHQSQTVEVYFVVPKRILPIFKLDVDVAQVRKDVVQAAGLIADDTCVIIDVVGVNYEEFRLYDHLDRLETKRFRGALSGYGVSLLPLMC